MNHLIETLNVAGTRFTAFAVPMLWQSGILIALLFVMDILLRRKVRATVRYALWMLLLVKLVLPPSLAAPTGAAYWLPASAVAKPGPTVAANPSSPLTIAAPIAKMLPVPTLAVPAKLFLAWLTVLLVAIVWVGWRCLAVLRMTRQATAAPPELEKMAEACRRQLGIERVIPIRCVDGAGSPAICGFLRPVIILPASFVQTLNAQEMRLVLLHELAHFKRRDLWVSHAQILLQVLYWYNPLLWLANARIRRVREQAVDEMVLVETKEQAGAYPEALLQVAKLSVRPPSFLIGMVGIMEPGHGLAERIRHILNRPLPQSARIGLRGFLGVLLLALVAMPMACRQEAVVPPVLAAASPKKLTDDQVLLFNTQQAEEIGARLRATEDAIVQRKTAAGVVSMEEAIKTVCAEEAAIRQELNVANAALAEKNASVAELERLGKYGPSKNDDLAMIAGLSAKMASYSNELHSIEIRKTNLNVLEMEVRDLERFRALNEERYRQACITQEQNKDEAQMGRPITRPEFLKDGPR